MWKRLGQCALKCTRYWWARWHTFVKRTCLGDLRGAAEKLGVLQGQLGETRKEAASARFSSFVRSCFVFRVSFSDLTFDFANLHSF